MKEYQEQVQENIEVKETIKEKQQKIIEKHVIVVKKFLMKRRIQRKF
jgi:hypothetical protein